MASDNAVQPLDLVGEQHVLQMIYGDYPKLLGKRIENQGSPGPNSLTPFIGYGHGHSAPHQICYIRTIHHKDFRVPEIRDRLISA